MNMVERVARAIGKLERDWNGVTSMADRHRARAAIEAMLEPSEGMVFAGGNNRKSEAGGEQC